MTKTRSNPRTENSVVKAINVLTLATNNRLSLSQASRESNFGRNYVSDIKGRLENNYSNKNVSRGTYRSFKAAWKAYNKTK